MKETYYFSHDYNARNDEKILELRSEFGSDGYAAFFMMLESMAENDDYGLKRDAIGGLSLGYSIPKDRLELIIEKCINLGLFFVENGRFFSQRMIDHKKFRKSLSKSGKNGAAKRWGNKEENSHPIATPLPPQEAPLMQSKVKEIKIKENNINNDVFDFWESVRPMSLNSHTANELRELCEEHKDDNVLHALKIASEQSKFTLAYVKGILRNEKDKGYSWDSKKKEPEKRKVYVIS